MSLFDNFYKLFSLLLVSGFMFQVKVILVAFYNVSNLGLVLINRLGVELVHTVFKYSHVIQKLQLLSFNSVLPSQTLMWATRALWIYLYSGCRMLNTCQLKWYSWYLDITSRSHLTRLGLDLKYNNSVSNLICLAMAGNISAPSQNLLEPGFQFQS